MRILFYLPVITPWWFDNIMVHLIRAAARDAEVHVAIAPMWRKSGIGEQQLHNCLDMPDIRWHVMDGDGHETLRTRPNDPDAVVEFVRSINPDYTFCRSADVETPSRFPGKVCFVMEGSVSPFSCMTWVVLQSSGLYDHGLVPPLNEDQRAYLSHRVRLGWELSLAQRPQHSRARADYLADTGLPAGRKVIALPLEYEGEESFFSEMHRATPPNAEFVAEIASQLGDNMVLAVTKHPLEQQLPFRHVTQIAAQAPNRIRIVEEPGLTGNPTLTLMQFADGVIVRDSKVYSTAAMFGTPMLRMSRFVTGEWMNAYTDVATFLDAVRSGTPRRPTPEDALAWFGFHHANNVFDAGDPGLTLEALIDRIERPFNPGRWAAALDRCRAQQPHNFA